jgi:hypothetical protein
MMGNRLGEKKRTGQLRRLQLGCPVVAKSAKGFRRVLRARRLAPLSMADNGIRRFITVAQRGLCADRPILDAGPDAIFEKFDPVTTDFAYIRWLGDRKGIERVTKVWNRIIVDRTAQMTS